MYRGRRRPSRLWRIVGRDKSRAGDASPRARQLAGPWRMGRSIGKNDHCIGALGGGRGKSSIQFLGRGRLDYRQSHAKLRAVRGTSSANVSLCIALSGLIKSAIFEALGTSSRRISTLFASDASGHGGRNTRDVAARMRQALHEADPHRIVHSHKHNRNGGGGRFQGYGCLRVLGQLSARDLEPPTRRLKQAGDPGRKRYSTSRFLPSIQPFSRKPLEPRGVSWVTIRLICPNAEETNSPRLPLRPRTPWQNEQCRSARNELPPLHSILIAA